MLLSKTAVSGHFVRTIYLKRIYLKTKLNSIWIPYL